MKLFLKSSRLSFILPFVFTTIVHFICDFSTQYYKRNNVNLRRWNSTNLLITGSKRYLLCCLNLIWRLPPTRLKLSRVSHKLYIYEELHYVQSATLLNCNSTWQLTGFVDPKSKKRSAISGPIKVVTINHADLQNVNHNQSSADLANCLFTNSSKSIEATIWLKKHFANFGQWNFPPYSRLEPFRLFLALTSATIE